MRTVLAERHRPLLAGMPMEQVRLLHTRLVQHRALRGELARRPVESGEELFELAAAAGLDHAGVVLTLARETSPLGLACIERLVGRPVHPWSDTRPALPPRPRGVAVARVRPESAMVVVSFVPNPKRPNTAGWERYKIYRVGALVSELVADGMWPADVRWDLERSFVVLASPDSDDGRAARQVWLDAQRGEAA